MPTFQKTLTDIAISGREYQVNRQVFPRFEFTLTYGGEAWLRDQTQNITPYGPLSGFVELEKLAGLFMQCIGSYGEFYYVDPDDNSRFAQPVGVGDGTTDVFPLFFTWGTGPFSPSFLIPVMGISSLEAVYFNGTPQSDTTYTLDPTLTQLIFDEAPSLDIVITADFSFYYRCRFLDDVEDFDQWAKNLWENKSLKFISVKADFATVSCLPSVNFESSPATSLTVANLSTLPSTSSTFLIAGWIMGLASGNIYSVFADTGAGGISLLITTTTAVVTFEVFARDSSGNFIFFLTRTYANNFANVDFHSFAISADTTSQVIQILVDGTFNSLVYPTAVGTWGSANPVAYFPSTDAWKIGPISGTETMSLSDFRFGAGEGFFDLSVPSNVAKLFASGNLPVNWGASGQLVTGVVPAVYMHGTNSTYATNKGSGGGFTLAGAFSSSSPLLCLGWRPPPASWGPPPSIDNGLSFGTNVTTEGGETSISSAITSLMTTSNAYSLIFVAVVCEDGTMSPPTVSSITGGGLTFAHIGASVGGVASLDFEIWWARSIGILTNQSFTVNFTSGVRNACFGARCVANSNYFGSSPYPFDSGAPLPVLNANASITPSVTIAQTHVPNDMLFFSSCCLGVAPPASPTGFIDLGSASTNESGGAGCSIDIGYKKINSLQTALTLESSTIGLPGACAVTVISGIP